MKKVLFLTPIIILAFVSFNIIQSKTLFEPSQGESKKPIASKPQSPRTDTYESPYVNGKAELVEAKFDFGYTPTRSSAYHPFHIRNVGTDTLDIVKIKPG
ncbi:MAG: hypothetical protein ABIK83_15750 [Candidatus Zixiibacteriota bacterium]